MKFKIRSSTHAVPVVALAAVLVMAFFAPARAVPAFMRQTNMSCNQCHTVHGGPIPNFTITGKKFRSTGYRMVDVREKMESGVSGQLGEMLKLPLLPYFSFRLQSTLLDASRNPVTAKWGEISTNPTTRFAFFWVGPIGDHLGVWNEFYFITNGSANHEWGLDLGSWDEWDLKWTFNPKNPKWQVNLGITNMPVSDVMGFGPFPVFAGGNQDQRGEVNGWNHPNYGTVFFSGWMYDRFIWLLGGNTGDTNVGWDYSNFIWEAGYAIFNTNANELWVRAVGRTGTDVMPLVTRNYVEVGGRDWSYDDAITGVTDTRPHGAGPYLARDIDQATSLEGEVRWSKQDWGSSSFEAVARASWNKDDYKDGASTELATVGFDLIYGWRHTYYAMPFVNSSTTYDFTDYTGTKYTIDNTPQYGINLGFKPTENFLVNLQMLTFQVFHLDRESDNKGRAISLYVDFLL
jgi:hypothetical protein